MPMRMGFLLAVLCLYFPLAGQDSAVNPSLTPRVDQRVVLMSVLYHLAAENTPGATDSPCLVPVNRYFQPYVHHPAVLRIKKLIANGQFDLQEMMILSLALTEPPQITLRVLASPDERWTEEILTEFLPLLRDFYRDSKFDQFYKSSAPVYQSTYASFTALLEKSNINWFVQFYGGKPGMTVHVLLDPYNGAGNFDFRMEHEDKSLHQYVLISNSSCDADGSPNYAADPDPLSGVVQDVNNSYIVPLVEDGWKKFSTAPELIYKAEAASMQTQGVANARILVEESLARAVSILAQKQSGGDNNSVLRRIRQEQGNGFVWMDKLVDQMGEYASNRMTYHSFKDFLPAITSFYLGLAPNIGAVKADFAAHSVHVVKIEPFANGASGVDPGITSLSVTFDKPLDTGRNFSFGAINDAEMQFPVGGQPSYANGGTRLVIPLALQPGQHYAFELSSDSFSTIDGYPLESYRVEFKTR